MNEHEYRETALALIAGGWTSGDIDDFIDDYNRQDIDGYKMTIYDIYKVFSIMEQEDA